MLITQPCFSSAEHRPTPSGARITCKRLDARLGCDGSHRSDGTRFITTSAPEFAQMRIPLATEVAGVPIRRFYEKDDLGGSHKRICDARHKSKHSMDGRRDR